MASAAALLLGWRPGEFWSATPAELGTALGMGSEPAGSIDGDALADLMRRFPDERGS